MNKSKLSHFGVKYLNSVLKCIIKDHIDCIFCFLTADLRNLNTGSSAAFDKLITTIRIENRSPKLYTGMHNVISQQLKMDVALLYRLYFNMHDLRGNLKYSVKICNFISKNSNHFSSVRFIGELRLIKTQVFGLLTCAHYNSTMIEVRDK